MATRYRFMKSGPVGVYQGDGVVCGWQSTSLGWLKLTGKPRYQWLSTANGADDDDQVLMKSGGLGLLFSVFLVYFFFLSSGPQLQNISIFKTSQSRCEETTRDRCW